jgi:dTDP-4-amino-4,6-dideoxygalactose transaminase
LNMTDILAAIGLVELERYDEDTLIRRNEICMKYNSGFAGKKWANIPLQQNPVLGTTSSYHLYPLRINGINETTRDRVIQKISEKGVSVNVHFIPVPMMSFYKKSGYDIGNFPVTYSLYSNEISLPVFYDLSDEQINTVINSVTATVEEEIYKEII